jgi:HEAT repeat protein
MNGPGDSASVRNTSLPPGSLGTVPWAELSHNYGPAADVPALFEAIAGPDAEAAVDACDELTNSLYHQGGWVCSAATAALPFVYALAGDPRVVPRVELVDLAGSLALTARVARPRHVDEGWPEAWRRERSAGLSLLTDADPGMRRAAVDLLAHGDGRDEANVPYLLERARHDEDIPTRLHAVRALGSVAVPDTPGAGDVRALLGDLIAHAGPAGQLSAIHALSGLDRRAPARHLGLTLDILTTPGIGAGLEPGWAEYDVGRIAGQIVGSSYQLLARERDQPSEPAPAAVEFVVRLARSSADADVRHAALTQAVALLSRWRSPTPVLLPVLAECLEDPEPRIRVSAAYLLAAVGRAAAPYADRLAAHLGDTGPDGGRGGTTVGDHALWGLTRLRDPRCLPGLVERLYAGRGTFAAHGSYGGGDVYPWSLPGFHEVLTPLRASAAALLPGIRATMRHAWEAGDRAAGRAFAQLLEAWEEDALPALPELVDLLTDPRSGRAAVLAVGAIGAGAANAGPALRRYAAEATEPAEKRLAAWALWRVSGEAGDALDALYLLGPALEDEDVFHDTIRRLGDLGPFAGAHANRLRLLAEDTSMAASDSWNRIESALALWSVTGVAEPSLSVLEEAVLPLGEGRYLPLMLRAVRSLTRIGAATPATRAALRAARAYDGRLAYFGGRRAFTEDEAIREAIDEVSDELPARAAPTDGR